MAGAIDARPGDGCRRGWWVALICAAAMTLGFGLRPATAQFTEVNPPWVGIPPVPNVPTASSRFERGQSDPNAQMMVRADELQYDNVNNRILANGSVQIYYQGSTLEADRVVYEQTSKRMRAEGNARLTEADGKVIVGEVIDLTDQFRDGFVDSLQIETVDKTRFAAPRAERQGGRYTVFQSGVYTACEPCKDDPTKPPKWQVKAARIVHDQTEKMMYFESARLELAGVPFAYVPYFSAPDPTVKRKTGFLMPAFTSGTAFGYGVETPFYWAIAPDYDATFNPRITTRQGVLFQGEFRQRLINGSYQIRAYGIDQLDRTAFTGQPGDVQFRGAVETKGQFALNDKWVWGWDGVAMSDYFFFSDYRLAQYKDTLGSFLSLPTEAISQLYLTGVGNRSYFDARTIYYLSYRPAWSEAGSERPFDYSSRSVAMRWSAGAADMAAALREHARRAAAPSVELIPVRRT